MSAKDLESSLRQGGEKVGEGRIRIDSARALQRLRDFRFAEPSHWVLEVLRAATLSDAKSIEVRTDADDVELSFDGKGFPRELMKSLLEQALNPGQTPDEKRTRLLALGVAGALGVSASFVKVISGGISLTLRGDEVQIEEVNSKGTELHLRKAFGWRVTAAFFRGSPEARAIADHAQRLPARLTLNGNLVQAVTAEQRSVELTEGKGWHLEARLPLGPPLKLTSLEIDVGGVKVTRRERHLPGLQVEAWLRADGLRRNASGSDVVDDDDTLEAALVTLRKISRGLLTKHGAELAQDPAWRASFIHMLLDEQTLDEQAKKALQKVPLIPGPAGELLSLDEINAAARTNSVVYTSKRDWPRGTYPDATVLLSGDQSFVKLLPAGKRVDVARLVKAKEVVALNRQRHEAMQVEEAKLADRNWVTRTKIEATAVTGEVGFEYGGNGAFVRVLHKGRLMEAGELTALSPLRLRAVVDWDRPLGDSFFSEGGGAKLLGLVLKYVENAATKAICDALPNPDVWPHAFDLLTRYVVNRDAPLDELPAPLRAAAIFTCLDGSMVSLDALQAEPRWRYVNSQFLHGPLDGSRVLLLMPSERDALKKLGGKRLEDVSAQLLAEAEVRRRIEGPKTPAEVENIVVKVPLVAEGMRGEVGIPQLPSTRLSLTLIKSGLVLETTELTARYHHAIASVDCGALAPNAMWDGATRDAAFKAVSAAVNDAQRLLAVELVKLPRLKWRFGSDLYLLAFLKKELVPLDPSKLDDVTRAVANARLFRGAHGPRSLLELKEQVARDGRFYVTNAQVPNVPKDFEVLLESSDLAEVLGEVLGRKPEDPTAALSALDARRRLQALPLAELKLPPGLTLECRVTFARFTVLAGLRDGLGDQASGHVHIDGRVYSVLLVPCALPLEVLIDAPTFEPNVSRELTAEERLEVGKLVASAMQAVVQQALKQPNDPASQRALFLAIAHGVDRSLPSEDAEALRELPLFPCTDGSLRTFRQIDGESGQYVGTEMQGVLPNGRPIVVAAQPMVRLALGRWPRFVRVDGELSMQLSAMRQREAVPRVAQIVSKVESPWRQKVSERDLTGEVVVASRGAGRLELFIDKKPLCVLEGVLPAPLAGAIDSPRLTPTPGFKGVVDDGNLKEAIEALCGAGERLAAQLASAPRVPELDPVLVQLAFWVGSTLAWQWKGKKKKGKKKPENLATQHALMAAPLLRATDTNAISLQELVLLQRDEGGVDLARQGGRFLEPGRRAWWPRPDEERWAAALGFSLNDVTAELQLADSIRQRPRYDQVSSPLDSTWRERVSGQSLEGEVAIGDAPDGQLVIEVLHERMLLETWSSEHLVGGVARVDSSALSPNEKWTQAKRDASFKALVSASEEALERLLLRRLADPSSPGFRAWAITAVRWRSGKAGALAGLVPSLPLFTDLTGEPVTIGAVFELARLKGKVPVARAFFSQEHGVLRDSADTRVLLSVLELAFEDVSGELQRAQNLQEALTTRRLASLGWKGESLVKIAVSTAGVNGELALVSSLETKREVMLAKAGIAIAPLEDGWPGVVGVIDVTELNVNDDWTRAELTRAQRSLIRGEVDKLYAKLAEQAREFSDRERELALSWALRFLLDTAHATPGQLGRLTDVAKALVDAPLFLTVEGERVNLRAVVDEVFTRGRVAVLEESAGLPEGVVSCVLRVSSFQAPWVAGLEEFLGKTKVWRVLELGEWRRTLREADPPEGAPELEGLRFLRQQVRLLRAGALGQLTPDDLEDVKLSRSGGEAALRYDKKRKLVFLDPDHPDIGRALKEAKQRPERLWVLIAAVFGLVNRELVHVTDAHEAQLLMALAGHLASNPKLLA